MNVRTWLEEIRTLVEQEATFDARTGEIKGLHQGRFHAEGSEIECRGCAVIMRVNKVLATLDPPQQGPIYNVETGEVIHDIPEMVFDQEPIVLGRGEPVPFTEDQKAAFAAESQGTK